jgi:hypothetical protein
MITIESNSTDTTNLDGHYSVCIELWSGTILLVINETFSFQHLLSLAYHLDQDVDVR